jgi:deoxyribose-phosphate aldolase
LVSNVKIIGLHPISWIRNNHLSKSPLNLSKSQLASFIQSTQIKPDLTQKELIAHVMECRKFNFNAAMIAPCWVPECRELLIGSTVRTATFIDFGMGSLDVHGKSLLIANCHKLGADEVDYAPNMGYLLSGMYAAFQKEAKELVHSTEGMPLKAMLQLGMIPTLEEKKRAILLLEEAGVAWIKNSSGGWPPGATPATVKDIRLIKTTLKGKSRVKASGGINDTQTALALIAAGAELLGTSHAAEIVEGYDQQVFGKQSDY